MKKEALILLLGVATIPAGIPETIPTSFNFSGWHIGSSVGYSQTGVKSVDIFQTDSSNANLQALNGNTTKTTLTGKNARVGFHGGYGRQHRSHYLGVEAEIILQNIKSSQKMNISTGLVLWVVHQAMIFLQP